MLANFHVNVITIKFLIYHIFVEKNHFLHENFRINHMVSKHSSNYVKWHGSIYLQLSYKLKII
jgi:hypothetical protein